MSIYNFCHLILHKDTKCMHWRKGSIFNKWCWGTGCPHAEELNKTCLYHLEQSEFYMDHRPDTRDTEVNAR